MSKWSSERTVKFIQEYKAHKCLWDFTSRHYRDKQRREAAILKLVEAMNLPDFGVAEVKNKIKNLRSTYNQEKKKEADSKRTGTGRDSVYESNVKWLKELEPVMNIRDTRKTFDNFHNEEDGQIEEAGNEREQRSSQTTTYQASIEATPTSPVLTPSCPAPPKKKTKILMNAVKDLKVLHAAINADEGEEDCFEAFGCSVAKQLRRLSEERALLAQKDIQNILSNYGIEDIRERKKQAALSRIVSVGSSSASTSSAHLPSASADSMPT